MRTTDPAYGTDYSSPAAESSVGLRLEPCHLDQILVTNDTATAGYVMLFDAIEAPTNGAVPKLPALPLPADPGCISLDFPKGIRFKKGCWARISSTKGTLTTSSNGAWFYAVLSSLPKL